MQKDQARFATGCLEATAVLCKLQFIQLPYGQNCWLVSLTRKERFHTARKLILCLDKMLDPEGKALEWIEEQVNESRKLLSQ